MDEFFESSAINAYMPENHVKYLMKLKNEGVEPKIIYDIGANVLQWSRESKKYGLIYSF